MQTRLAQKVNENTAQGEALFIESIRKVKNQVLVSSNLSEEKYNNYVQDFIDRNPSTTTGFKVSAGEYKEGDLIFDEIPNFASELMMANEPELVDEFEAEQYDTINTYNSYIEKTKASVRAAKQLLDEFDKLGAAFNNNDNYKNTRKYLEEYTHIGTDYVLYDPEKNQIDNEPTDNINLILVKNATKNLITPVADLSDERCTKC